MHLPIHQRQCCLLFFLGIFLVLPNTFAAYPSIKLDDCAKDWRCDYWKTDNVCPYSDGWDCFIFYYTNICPSVPGPSGPTRDSRCDSVDIVGAPRPGDPNVAFSCYDYEDFCVNYAECSNYIKPKDCCTFPGEPFFIFNCYCKYIQNRKVSIMLNNGIRNYTITQTFPKWDGLQTFEEVNKYTLPQIDCIDIKEPPFNLTIQEFCFNCNYDGLNTSYVLSLTSGSDGTVQTRSVPNLDLLKRPKRWTDYNDCISETYVLEKAFSCGSSVIQISKPGTYTWNLKVVTSNLTYSVGGGSRRFKNYDLKYDFKIDGYCNSTIEPVPKKTMNISIYQEFEANVWKEIVKSSADAAIKNVCITRDKPVTIQAYPDESDLGVPMNVTFELIRPDNSSFTQMELCKPYFLYGDLPKSNEWFGLKWFRTGIYKIKITPKYSSSKTAATTFVKTINVTKFGDCVRGA